MYAQTFLLSLTARGFDGIPQTMLGFYADVVREFLGVPEELKLLFGISFGTVDQSAPVNGVRMGRAPLEQSVVLHGTPERMRHQPPRPMARYRQSVPQGDAAVEGLFVHECHGTAWHSWKAVLLITRASGGCR